MLVRCILFIFAGISKTILQVKYPHCILILNYLKYQIIFDYLEIWYFYSHLKK